MYSYKELEHDLEMGHEVEFFHMEQKYSISNNKDGWYLTRLYDENYQSFKTAQELLEYGRINGKTLADIWNQVKVETVF
ncbi:hypothetical protein [Methylomusa anaerophila]|uniref:Uncharacterized protein n=1 Tax=Methylomusa anaerophila TaxID=1930071 RepID=A0A348AH96_9FIRM|nr:hypothetical protein [Methylomusa anaerophila]BBB90444.1 hypothetical protein MAMMFC1_01095 [Methylomusa anaerophila]